MFLALGAGAAGAMYLSARGEELLSHLDADEALTRATEHVGAES
jgi:hypothetical protein